MIDSWQKSPQWEQYQNQITQMGLEQIRAGFQQFLQQMQAYHQARTAAMNPQVAHFESHQNAQAQQGEQQKAQNKTSQIFDQGLARAGEKVTVLQAEHALQLGQEVPGTDTPG